MHSMVLGAAGYTLLLSSFVTLMVLLKKGFKQCAKTPLHVLSISDIVSSVLTAVILLVNQFKMTNTSQCNDENKTQTTDNYVQLLKVDNESEHHEAFARFYQKYNSSYLEENNFNATSITCNFNDVLMHYAMFLVPFTNAFVSLLSFTAQCSTSAACISKMCTRLTILQQSITEDCKGINDNFVNPVIRQTTTLKRGDSASENDLESISENFMSEKKIWNIVLNTFKATELNELKNNNNKVVGVSVLSQWLAPVLLTAILYFFERQDMRTLHYSKDMECIFMINFPFENCYVPANITGLKFSYSGQDIMPVANDYIENQDTLRISNPDSKEAEEVVSKIYKLVQSALNETYENVNLSMPTTYYNASQLWNVTKYVNKSDYIYKSTENKDNIVYDEIGFNEQTPINRNHNVLYVLPGIPIIQNKEVEHDAELKLFEDLMRNKSEGTNLESSLLKNNTYYMQENNVQNFGEANSSITDEYSSKIEDLIESVEDSKQTHSNLTTVNLFQHTMKNDTSNTKNQIYADIVKRIQSITTQYRLNEKYKGPSSGGKEQNTQEKLHIYSLNKRPVMDDSIFSFKNGSILRRARDKNIIQNTPNVEIQLERTTSMKDRCFLPIRLLRIHLLITVFLVYFIPILISCILYIRAKFMCQHTLEKLKMKGTIQKMISTDNLDSDTEENKNQKSSNINHVKGMKGRSGWFLHERKNPKLGECSSTNEYSRKIENYSDNEDVRTVDSLASKNDKEQPDENDTYTNILKEAEETETLSQILKKSLLFGVLLWTPMFLDILVKVFLCTNTPSWLTNGSFLSGISFGIIRNIFNLGMVNSQGIDRRTNKKQNSIHPRT